MTTARCKIVRRESPGVYHCTVRCVRRAFLCGFDRSSGRNYEHRRDWVVGRLGALSRIFDVEVYAYCAMSNHLHVVLKTRPDRAAQWTDQDVARRWLELYPPRIPGADGPAQRSHAMSLALDALARDAQRIALLRERLASLSWFMKSLNEFIARKANKEDDCKGRFWEGRFRCQRLDDEAAILACMCYVDLNPIRAGMAISLSESRFTSALERIERLRASHTSASGDARIADPLAPKLTPSATPRVPLIDLDGPESPFAYWGERQYLDILDASGRQIRGDRPGFIPQDVRPLLESLDLNPEEWINTLRQYNRRFGPVAGSLASLERAAAQLGKRWLKGARAAALIANSRTAIW